MTRNNPVFRPRSRALALEPRILFDGAAAVAVDQQAVADHVPNAPQAAAEAPPHTLVVIDTRIDNYQSLAEQAGKSAEVVLVGANQDGLKAISDALAAGGKVDSIQILSHGAAGQFTLGNRTVSADNVATLSDTLRAWTPQLTANADILLYGCGVGAGESGRALIAALASTTGADVAASTNDTGAVNAGGDWNLEVSTGPIESSLAAVSYEGLLADASPTVSLGSSVAEVSLGGTFSFTASFTNPSSQVGYAPYIDLFFPATGKDGGGAEIDDGATFVSATFLGQPVTSYVLTFDASGNATHPLARDANGDLLIINAATYGMQAGDQLVVLSLPFASMGPGQPPIDVRITGKLSDLADTAASNPAPELTIKARGGFELGNDALDNAAYGDPSLVEAMTHAFTITPTVISLTQSIDIVDGETATGPNFSHNISVTATPAPGQTLDNVVVTQTLPGAIRVTAITPGAGGTLTSITLSTGAIIQDPALIQSILADGRFFVSAYTVEYATLSAPTTTTVTFYIPETDAQGNPTVDPLTGDAQAITVGKPTASGEWLPLDVRDQKFPLDPNTGLPDLSQPPIPATVTGNGNDAGFAAKSITVHKSASFDSDIGEPGLTPGDTLRYTIDLVLSDYFAFGQTTAKDGSLTLTDTLGNGQVLGAVPTFSFSMDGIARTIPLVTTQVLNPDGTTTLQIDIAASLLQSGLTLGALRGDLAFDNVLQGATTAVISYSAIVAQKYANTTYPQPDINEGDSVGNNASVAGTILTDPNNLTGPVGEKDAGSATSTVPTRTVDIAISSVNGAAFPPGGELRPGDLVTYRLSYDLVTSDYESFSLASYLPLPLFALPATWIQDSNPGDGVSAGQWALGAGNTNLGALPSVSSGPGNSVVFNFGDFAIDTVNGSRIEVEFTLEVSDDPFADQRSLTILSQSDQLTTIPVQQHLISSDAVVVASIAEPRLDIKHGVVASSNGTVSGTSGIWNAPGTTGVPFSGSITDLSAVDGSVTGIDAGDTLRLSTAIENSGGGGAFDVTTDIALPGDLAFVGGSLAAANLQVHRGDGTALVLGTDYSVSGNTITFLDANGVATLQPGRSGTPSDLSGANLVVITYDVTANALIAASRTLQSTARLTRYASVDGGGNFTPQPRSDNADQQVAAPAIGKGFANGSLDDSDSSASHTIGSSLVIGESMLYDIVVTLPEGTTQSLRIDDLTPPGLRFDGSFNSGAGFEVITTVAGSAALSADFNGSLTGVTLAGTRLTVANNATTDDNVTTNNSFVIRVRLIADNVITNQANESLQNSAQIVYSDPDGDTANGSTPVDRTVALSGGKPTVTVREPTLTIAQTAATSNPNGNVERNDLVTYTITIRNNNGTSDFNAFDISFSNSLPFALDFGEPGLGLQSVVYAGGATDNGGPGFILTGRDLTTASGANIDIPKGGSITLTVVGRVNLGVGSVASFTNTSEVQWTSLDGADPNERTGADGLLNSGVLNDYRQTASATVNVSGGATLSHVGGLPDTPLPLPTDQPQTVAVGEIIRYRAAILVPQGVVTNASAVINLPTGLSFLNDGSATVGLLSNGGLSSSDASLQGAAFEIDASIADKAATLLTATLSSGNVVITNGMSGALSSSLIDASNPNQIVINFGTLINNDVDNDLEAVYVDFNVRVDNLASVDTNDSFSVSAIGRSNTIALASSPSAIENIVEPTVANLTKTVTSFDPNTSGATGSATVSIDFRNSGDGVGYDFHLADSVNGGSNYIVTAVIIDGATYAPGSLPGGVTVSTSAAGISADFDRLAQGSTVRVVYTVDVANSAAVAASDATLEWTSLPLNFGGFAGSTVGLPASPSGERDGSGGTTPPNTYVRSEGAGLGIIRGTLWDDTTTPNGIIDAGEVGLAGQTVTLTWAGVDGDLATIGDNLTYTTVTASNGTYYFGVLPAGNFRIDVPNPVVAYPFVGNTEDAQVRVDSDATSPLGQIVIAVGEGAGKVADAGYVRYNDAPVNTVPGPITIYEDNQPISGQPPGPPVPITGISIGDVDAANGVMRVALAVAHGKLNLTDLNGSTVDSGALDSATVTVRGTLAQLNAALATLTYKPDADYNGSDTVTIVSNDLGNTGDYDGNLIPNQPSDARTATSRILINITPVNDAPIANPDTATAVEAGGTFNGTPGRDPSDNLIANDFDVDVGTNGDILRVQTVSSVDGANTNPINIAPGLPTTISGKYGSLLVGRDGDFQYLVDNDNPEVQALRLSGQTLAETFNYTIADLAGATASSTLTVTIEGANDTPVGVDDDGTVYEAGGINNTTPGGVDFFSNVLGNDTDVDSTANGETRSVTGIRHLKEAVPGVLTAVSPGSTSASNGTTVTGTYGALTIGADGSYAYALDNANTAVERLVPGDTLFDYFSYQVTDALGLNDLAQITITIKGANDNPVASDDLAEAQALTIVGGTINGNRVDGGTERGSETNPTGNVIRDASRPGNITDPGGNGVDFDVDRTDYLNTNLVVSAIRTGTEAGSGTAGTLGVALAGKYGTLTINADGSFVYDVDSRNATVWGLGAGQTLTDEYFTYELTDSSGLTDRAQLNIIVHGVNDPPVAQNVNALAKEAGGVANGSPGLDPTGDATYNDFDPDGDPITVTLIRAGTETAAPPSGDAVTAGGTTVVGTYGSLTIHPDGTYAYVVDNSNPAVEALRQTTDELSERFTYTISDNASPPETDQAEIIVTIQGKNDNPVAADDVAVAVEAGGVGNNIPGSDPAGDVLTNDSDVDNVINGETKEVSAFRTGSESGSGTAGTLGSELRGTYGWLTLNADGKYSYRLDNADPAVEALRLASQTLTDTFTYTVRDTYGATDNAQLVVTIEGANDTPVARNDTGDALEAGGVFNATPGSPATGNVLANDSDVDSVANGETKAVASVSGAASGTVNGQTDGNFGSLVLNADGSFTYTVDDADPVVEALRLATDTLTDVFTYTVRDTAGATAIATLTITIHGANDNPVAADDSAVAQEKGGNLNATPGIDPTGDLLANDTDVDANDGKTVDGIRTGSESAGGAFTAVSGSYTIAGLYGSLTVDANGQFSYVVNNNLPAVEAMRPGEVLDDSFTYRMHDKDGASDTAQINVQIGGAWDAPVAYDDFDFALPQSATQPGYDPSGNVLLKEGFFDTLSDDTDVDANDVLSVTGIRAGDETLTTPFDGVNSNTDNSNGTLIDGAYGQLIIGSDGTYTYRVDSANPTIIALGPLDFVREQFTYRVSDLGNESDVAQLTILIRGRNDAPVVQDDAATAIEAGGLNNAIAGSDPGGNVLANDSDPEGDPLRVSAFRTGDHATPGTSGTLGMPLRGLYGDLTVNADGTWNYVLDNTLAAVEALRISGQTLTDTFTYTATDIWNGSTDALLTITIDGRNDTPVASADTGAALEAGGRFNTTPGNPATGDVLANDSDVDSVANGESKTVIAVAGVATGAVNGQTAGKFGSLTLNADGSFTYTVDDTNPAVEALRTAAETLNDTFTYTMRDTAGSSSTATLTITIHGANDNPVAADDAGLASDEAGPPVTTGNVLANDSDVDGGDSKTVVAIRTGAENGSGSMGSVGARLQGRYGWLVLNADGSWRYEVDTSNREVLGAAGAGKVLSDVFTYAVRDTAGATDQAQLTVTLDMVAPYNDFPPSPFFDRDPPPGTHFTYLPELDPVVFVGPVVREVHREMMISNTRNDGTDIRAVQHLESSSTSLAAGLGDDPSLFVTTAVRETQEIGKFYELRVAGRQGVVSLSADGLLADPSPFVPDPLWMVEAPAAPRDMQAPRPASAPSFREQLQQAARRFQPVAVNLPTTRIPGGTIHSS